MSGFVPLLRLAALRAMPALLLASVSAGATAQGPAASVLIGAPAALRAQAYGNADRVASSLLAGGMSQLAAISAQQGGAVPTPWAPPLLPAEAVINGRRIQDFIGKLPGWRLEGVRLSTPQSAVGYRPADIMPSFMRDYIADAAMGGAPASAFVMPARPAFSSSPSLQPAPRAGQPDIFGSVALPISRTALDGKWASIAQPLSGKGSWNALLQSARQAGGQQRIEMINSWVNRRLRFVDDRQGGDYWSPAGQSLTRGTGDCEDYAIAKMKLLEAAGFDRHAMFLVVARDLVRQADHAVLAVRIGNDLMVLDNMTDRVLPSSSVSDYRPIMSFNAFGRWTHGYRVTTPQPVRFAAR